jgi:DNA-binding XRE family transcriptional regulator
MRRLRIVQGFSTNQLAQKAILNTVTINKIENGKHSPNPSTALKICKALGVEFDEIFELVDISEKQVS